MNQIKTLLFLITIGLISCKNPEKKFDRLERAKEFYVAIDHSNPSKATKLISDSFTTTDDGFEQTYNENEYAEWIKWDSVFHPTYEVLKMEEENGTVKTKISKVDKRILFLHHDPIITEEIMEFEGEKIKNIHRISVSFNVEAFVENRDELVKWISEHHPELNGFLNDQTQNGGMNYLKAIELYNNRK